MKRIIAITICLVLSLNITVFAEGTEGLINEMEPILIECGTPPTGDPTILLEPELYSFNDNVEEIPIYESLDTPVLYDKDVPELIICPPPTHGLEYNVYYGDDEINYDVSPMYVNGVIMLPLRFTLEEMGYEIEWVPEEYAVEIKKGAEWTKIYIGENSYFQNKKVPMELSCGPIIIDGRTLVPIEFFHEIMGFSFELKNDSILFLDNEIDSLTTHKGTITSIEYNDDGMDIYLSQDDSGNVGLIAHVSYTNTIIQSNFLEGMEINVVTYPMMTMSYPGRVYSILIY